MSVCHLSMSFVFFLNTGNPAVNRYLATAPTSTPNSITICPGVGRLAYGRSNSLPANRCGYSLSYERYSLTRQLSSPLEGIELF